MYKKILKVTKLSLLYVFWTLDIRGMNDIRLMSRPNRAPYLELGDTDTNKLLIKVVSKRILVQLVGIRWTG